jgi:predicted nucleic acid-binding Zn ribbon protein
MPIYTYRCPKGHEWDEVRGSTESETSDEACSECEIHAAELGDPITDGQRESWMGRRVPSSSPPSARFIGTGWTPTHYRNRKDNK